MSESEHVQEIETIVSKAAQAAAVFTQYDQAQVDRIARAVYEAGFNHRVPLAKLAHAETGLGKWQDKVLKNVVATQLVYEDIKDLPTVGIVHEDHRAGIVEIACPMGPILAIIPVTNPTSTVLFKILIALKTRNPIIISPSKKARKCSIETARLCYEAALKEDAPEDCVQWVEPASREQTQHLMCHPRIALILATGGTGLVHSAYSSGTPALGVGAGNVPVFVERTADLAFTVEQILISKTFDYGTICASEQAIIAEQCVAGELIAQFQRRQGYFLSKAEVAQLENVAFDRTKGLMNAEIVGQSAEVIAKQAGLQVPLGTQLLLAPLEGVGKDHPLSSEILAPILAFYTAKDFEHAVDLCIELNFHGGIGHTVSIFSNDEAKIKQFAGLMNAGRIVVNTPSSQGAVGGIFNTLSPSLTLGCGTGGKNITTDNITARHLLNIQRIARRRMNISFTSFDQDAYLDETLDAHAIETAYHRNT